jgi:hypothetical protein
MVLWPTNCPAGPPSTESDDAAGLLTHLHRVGCHTIDELKTTLDGMTGCGGRLPVDPLDEESETDGTA